MRNQQSNTQRLGRVAFALSLVLCVFSLPALGEDRRKKKNTDRQTKSRQEKRDARKAEDKKQSNEKSADDMPPVERTITDDQVKRAAANIDRLVVADLKKHDLQPAPAANELVLVRRIYLDVIGRIPTMDEMDQYFSNEAPDRLPKLIDDLLASPGHESHMFNWLGDMFRVKDEYYRIGKTWTFHTWLKSQLRENRPWNELVHDLLTAEGRLGENGATAYLLRDASMPLDSLSNTLTTFLGANVACAQCHDHPFAEWTQRDFYEMASFFGSTAFERVDTRKPALTLRDERFSKANLVTLLQPNMERVVYEQGRATKFPEDYAYDDALPGDKVVPKFITWEGATRARVTTTDPRQLRNLFARWMTSPNNPRFAEAIANRMWKKFFGVAVKEPVTDLDVLEEATNPELLTFLALLMRHVDFDLREFQRVILNTKTYQREVSVTPPEGEDFRFPGPLLRRMTAEQTWDSIVLLLRGPEIDRIKTNHAPMMERLVFPFEFEHDRKNIAKDREKIFDFAMTLLGTGQTKKTHNSDGGRGLFMGSSKRKVKLRGEDSWLRASELPQPMPPTHFLRVAGQSAREVADDGSTEGGITESLAMMNGAVMKSLMGKASQVEEARNKHMQAMQIASLYRTCLSRPPSDQDMKQCISAVNQGLDLGDITWALLNTREFLFIQ